MPFIDFYGGVDQIPDALNWANIGPGDSPQENADQTISGINTTITIVATLSAGSYDAGGKGFILLKNGSAASTISGASVANGGFVSTTVVAGDTVRFQATKGAAGSGTSWGATATVTVTETGATLDTFTVSVDAPP